MNNDYNHRRGLDPVERHQRTSFLRRTARETRNYRTRMKVMTAALAVLTLLTGIFFIISALYNRTGSFTVMVSKVDMTQYGITLSESRDMSYKTSHLNAQISESITNISSEIIPDNVDEIDGVHNGANYIAYTFYLQNGGEVPVPVEYTANMSSVTSGLDEAIRLRLYVNGEETTYAKIKRDGSGPEPGTTPFPSATVMARGRVDDLDPGEVVRFTVVIWIEGPDPDCLDPLIGGQMKIDMNFAIVH